MFETASRRWLAVAIGLVVAGAILLVLGADVAAFAVAGVGAVLAVGVAFYVVGRGEDRDRAQGSA